MGTKKDKSVSLPKIESVVAEGTVITGNITAKSGTIRIDGKVDGKTIKAQGIIIGEKGRTKSNLHANVVIISGYLQSRKHIALLQSLPG